MDTTLGKRITANRKRLGLTQDQLAEKLGITAQAVSKWENDLSCPDISILPKLADIFCITTDELLGREPTIPVCQTEVVYEEKEENGFTFDNGKLNLHWDGVKLEGIGLACWVLLTGVIYLISQLTHIDISFWNILWPSFLFMFGLFGLYPKFSAFRLGCALVGGYFLVEKLHILAIELDNGIVFAVIILLFGCSLMADAIRKSKSPKYSVNCADKHGKMKSNYHADGDQFTYEAAFGSSTQAVVMEKLRYGMIATSFGEYEVNLTQVDALDDGCRLEAECSFGELTILVPRCYTVVPDSSTAFASFDIKGCPDSTSRGTIHLSASVSFGEISIHYL